VSKKSPLHNQPFPFVVGCKTTMKLIRLLALLLLSTPLCTRAVPAFSLSETWSELAFFRVGGSTIVPMYTNGTASITFSGLKMTNAGPITSSTQFSFLIGNFYITAPLSGDYSDPNNPIVSSYIPTQLSSFITTRAAAVILLK
jgi:hypothetical protein